MLKKLITLAAVIIGVTVAGAVNTNAIGGEVQACASGLYEIQSPQDGAVITGPMELILASTQATNDIERVKFLIDHAVVGEAFYTNSYYYWEYLWDSNTTSDGPHELQAWVRTFGGTECFTAPTQIEVYNQNQQNYSLSVQVSPVSWQGPVHVNRAFDAKVFLKNLSTNNSNEVTAAAAIDWQLGQNTPGYLSKINGSYTTYFSGPSSGSGYIHVTAHYGGFMAQKNVYVTVSSSTSESSSYPEDTYVEDDELQADEAPESIQITNEDGSLDELYKREGDKDVNDCIEDKLGEKYQTTTLDQKKRLSAAEFELIRSCFAKTRYVVPSHLAPIAPEDVPTLPESKNIKIERYSNVPSFFDNLPEALTFEGTSAPNAVLLLYVYSEPLVLTTTADSDGRWSYTLEDPLEPGEHEVYVAVQEDGQYVKSDRLVFAIEEQPASIGNPNGLNLKLNESFSASTDEETSTSIFIIGAGAVTFLALVLLSRFVWQQNKPGVPTAQSPPDEPQQP